MGGSGRAAPPPPPSQPPSGGEPGRGGGGRWRGRCCKGCGGGPVLSCVVVCCAVFLNDVPCRAAVCPWVECCVALLCWVWCVVLYFLVLCFVVCRVRCSVVLCWRACFVPLDAVLRCLLCAGWRRLLLSVVFGCSLEGRVASCCFLVVSFSVCVPVWLHGRPFCCLAWFAVLPSSPVLCHVLPRFRVGLCCRALLSFLLRCFFVAVSHYLPCCRALLLLLRFVFVFSHYLGILLQKQNFPVCSK